VSICPLSMRRISAGFDLDVTAWRGAGAPPRGLVDSLIGRDLCGQEPPAALGAGRQEKGAHARRQTGTQMVPPPI